MQIPILLEVVAGSGYRARSGPPLDVSAEGATPAEALQNLRQVIAGRLAGGAQLLSIEVPGAEHPLARFAGMYKDDPLFDEWQQAIAEYRREADAEAEAP